jgi:hypothetical protein
MHEACWDIYTVMLNWIFPSNDDIWRCLGSCVILFLLPCLDVLVREWGTGSVAMEKDLRKEKAEPTSKI